jgi:hypothetical protein
MARTRTKIRGRTADDADDGAARPRREEGGPKGRLVMIVMVREGARIAGVDRQRRPGCRSG